MLENELSSIRAIKAGVFFDEGKLSSEYLHRKDIIKEGSKQTTDNLNLLNKKYVSILNDNDYDMFAWEGVFDSPSGEKDFGYFTEVYFGPECILDHLKFEKELLNNGYDVRFERFGEAIEKDELQ